MANSNFIVHNGLTVGPYVVFAGNGDIQTTGNVTTTSTAALQAPAGNTAQRPGTAALGMIRYNSTISSFEGYGAGSAWSSLGGVKSVDGYATITAEASAGAGDDVLRFYSGSTGSSVQVMWASAGNVSVLPTTAATSTTTGALQVAGGASVQGNFYVGGNLTVSGNTIQVNKEITTGDLLPSANLSYNLGSTTAYWNNIYANVFVGTATSAKYADLAENYQSDKAYMAGTVLMFGGSAEVTVADADTTAVAGVVSTNPAHLMNGGLTGTNVVPLALQGRVPCQVIGPVKKGDMMVSAGHGFAKVNNTPAVGTVIGKALQEVTFAGKAVIEVVVGRV